MKPAARNPNEPLFPARIARSRAAVGLAAAAGGVLSLGLIGCESDSFIDPSVMGRWEHTPTKVPILERIASIEDAKGDLVEHSAPTAEDLYTDSRDYRVGAGDTLTIQIWEFVQTGAPPENFERVVDPIGMIELPQLGRLFVSGKTIEQVRDVVTEGMKKYTSDPLVAVDIRQLRQQTFTLVGSVEDGDGRFL